MSDQAEIVIEGNNCQIAMSELKQGGFVVVAVAPYGETTVLGKDFLPFNLPSEGSKEERLQAIVDDCVYPSLFDAISAIGRWRADEGYIGEFHIRYI